MLFYMLPAFSPFIPSSTANYRFGWIFIYTMGPLIALNFIFIVVGAIQICINSHRRHKAKVLLENSAAYKKEVALKKLLA